MNVVVQRTFDWDSLDSDTRVFVQEKTQDIRIRLKRGAEDIVAIGYNFLAVQEKLAPIHKFAPWLRSEFDMGLQTAYNFMWVAERFGNLPIIGRLANDPTILYMLAAPKTPEIVVEEARQGWIPQSVAEVKKRIQDVKAATKQKQRAEQAASVILPQEMQLHHADFRIIGHELPDKSVDLVFTDPPYHEKYLPLWTELGEFAARVLKPGGMLLAYSGQRFLPDVLNRLSEYLSYCWLLGVAHTGGHIQIWEHKIWNDWKPLVMFSRGKPVEHDWLFDLYRGDKGDKEAHEWAQGEGEAAYFIEKLTQPGQLVVDPMCGSGTIVRIAHKMKRLSIGMEIEEDRYITAKADMKEVVRV